MKREDTYTIYRSEARGEAVRDARNTSEGKKSFIRMKQKFLPKETAVPSEGNFAHLSGSYRPACKLFALITALLLLGANWNGAWGQTQINVPINEITASSTATSSFPFWDYDVDNLTDGRANTTWQSANNDNSPYLVLDLGSVQKVDVININFETRASNVTVTYSTDNNQGTGSAEISFPISQNGNNELRFDETISAKYIRLAFTRRNNNAVSISELSLEAKVEYTITPHNGTFPHVDVPTLVDTVYVRDGEERTLVTGNYEYYWYFRWYRRNMNEGAAEPTTIERITPTTEGANYLVEVTDDPSYFWAYNIRPLPGEDVYAEQKNHSYVASIVYKNENVELDSVFCDVSFNVDNLGVNPIGPIYQEPTIGKRYKFIIKPAEEMRKRLESVKAGEAMETIYITVPSGATNVNLPMDMEPNSYFWGNSANPTQGSYFQYSINDGAYTNVTITDERAENKKLISISGDSNGNGITNTQTVLVRAVSSGEETSSTIVKFVLTPQINSGFLTEDEIFPPLSMRLVTSIFSPSLSPIVIYPLPLVKVEIVGAYVDGLPIPSSSSFLTRDASEYLAGAAVNLHSALICLSYILSPIFISGRITSSSSAMSSVLSM